LGSWPRLPLIIDYSHWGRKGFTTSDKDNVFAALEDSERVRYLGLTAQKWLLEKVVMAMRKPFPELTHLCLSISSEYEHMRPLPDEFLAGSASELQVLKSGGIPFPALPQFLLSARHLVDLQLTDIPDYDHFSPGVMITTLATMTELRTLFIDFRFNFLTPQARSNTVPPVSQTRIVLPSLTTFNFSGLMDYLEDLLAQLDTPRLDRSHISYFIPLPLHFQVPELSKFIDRAQNHDLVRLKHSLVTFGIARNYVQLYFERVKRVESHYYSLEILFLGTNRRLPYVVEVTQILSQLSDKLSNVDHLSINVRATQCYMGNYMDAVACLEFLRPFTAAVTLDVHKAFARHVAYGLEGATEEMVAELMPSLRSLCLMGVPVTSSARFVEVRRLSGRPVTISN